MLAQNDYYAEMAATYCILICQHWVANFMANVRGPELCRHFDNVLLERPDFTVS